MAASESKTSSPLPLPWLIGQVLAIVGLAATLGWKAAYESTRLDETRRNLEVVSARTDRSADALVEVEKKLDVTIEILKRVELRMDRQDAAGGRP